MLFTAAPSLERQTNRSSSFVPAPTLCVRHTPTHRAESSPIFTACPKLLGVSLSRSDGSYESFSNPNRPTRIVSSQPSVQRTNSTPSRMLQPPCSPLAPSMPRLQVLVAEPSSRRITLKVWLRSSVSAQVPSTAAGSIASRGLEPIRAEFEAQPVASATSVIHAAIRFMRAC